MRSPGETVVVEKEVVKTVEVPGETVVVEKEVVSPTHWTFNIRPGVSWQNLPPMNGREVTAQDVEWSYHRSLGLGSGFTEGTPNDPSFVDMPWESVTATDKYTVEVRLKSLNLNALPEFLLDSGTWVYPREVIEQYGDLNDWRHFVGSGPFLVTDHVLDSSWTFNKNPDYWAYDEKYPENRLPYVDTVKLLIIPDALAQLAGLRAGKLDRNYILWEVRTIRAAPVNYDCSVFSLLQASRFLRGPEALGVSGAPKTVAFWDSTNTCV